MRAIGCVCALSEPCGRFTLMALGTTIVEVSMKNINKRNMISVIDDIEKPSMVLVFLLIITLTVIAG